MMNNLLGENNEKHRRSNRILYKKNFVQYPFENDLSKLPDEDRKYCVNTFLHNPYENYPAGNMLQFFLKTFGEGITNTYLRPYNEKIWKFDPSFMDTQMVDRIPKPPKEDIIRSAKGATIDGYTHQLYFTYPKQGGTEALIHAFRQQLSDKVEILVNHPVTLVEKSNNSFIVTAGEQRFVSDRLVSTIPLDEFTVLYQKEKDDAVIQASRELRHNSIAIAVVNVDCDNAGDNYAFMIADKTVIFHRLSKLDFMGSHYHKENTVTYMLEITYRKNDIIDLMSDKDLMQQIIDGLISTSFIDDKKNVKFTDIKRFEYAYVIYDINNIKNTNLLISYFSSEGVELNGRFGSFKYLNMDAIIRQSKKLSENYNI